MEKLSFLLEKWKHHDGLIYHRSNTFWTVQSVSIGATILILSSDFENYSIKVIFGMIPILFACVVGRMIITMAKIDKLVRNSFNKSIVEELIKQGGILKEENLKKWESDEEWNVGNSTHPINLWHTHTPFERGKSFTQASRFQQRTLNSILIIEALLVICMGIEFFVQVLK